MKNLNNNSKPTGINKMPIVNNKKTKKNVNSLIHKKQVQVNEIKKNPTFENNKNLNDIDKKIFPSSKKNENQLHKDYLEEFVSLNEANPPSWVFGRIDRKINYDNNNYIFGIGSGYKTKKQNQFYDSENMARQQLIYLTQEFKIILTSELDKEIKKFSDLDKQQISNIIILIDLLTATILSKSKIVETWEHPKRLKNFALASIDLGLIASEIINQNNLSKKVTNLFYEKYIYSLRKSNQNSHYIFRFIEDGIEYENIDGNYFMY
jgi:hypothetical protein